MRKSLSLMLFIGLGSVMAQVEGGHDTVQDAIRFERQKDAADARQARIEASRSNADRASGESTTVKKGKTTQTGRKKTGSTSRSTDKPDNQDQ
jgi:hypothetical protein